MEKKIIWKMEDGSVRVTTPAPKGRRKGESELDWIGRVAAKAKPEGAIRCPDCLASELPSREFRHKWRHDGKIIIIDNSVPDLPIVRSLKEQIDDLRLLIGSMINKDNLL